MSGVCLRHVTQDNFRTCIALEVALEQKDYVAPNLYSLAQAKVNPRLTPWAIYDRDVLGRDVGPDDPMVGFCMVEHMDGVGFIMRLMVDHRFQRRGYGRAAMQEVLRRFRVSPDIEVVATSVRKGNTAAEALYASLGFVENPMVQDERETQLLLDWPEGTVAFIQNRYPLPDATPQDAP